MFGSRSKRYGYGQQMADHAIEPETTTLAKAIGAGAEVRAMQGYWPPSGTYVTWDGGCGWSTESASVIVARWGQAIRLGGTAVVGFSVIEGGMGEPFEMFVRADQITSVADRSKEFEEQKRRRAAFEAAQTAVQGDDVVDQELITVLDVRKAQHDGP
jgi:hypothetical protein